MVMTGLAEGGRPPRQGRGPGERAGRSAVPPARPQGRDL